MSRNEAIEELKKLHGKGDKTANHRKADDILCELLKNLGHGDVVEEWNKVGKRY